MKEMYSAVNVFVFAVWLVSLPYNRHIQNGVDAKPAEEVYQPGQTIMVEAGESEVEIMSGNDVLYNLRELVHSLDHETLKKEVHKIFESIGNLNSSDIPATVDTKNGTAVESFQRQYRTYLAILRTWLDDGVVVKFKQDLREVTQVECFDRLAVLMAQLSDWLSKLEDEQCAKVKVDWNDEIEVIEALKGWDLTDDNILNVARAFYRLKRPKNVAKRIKVHAADIEDKALTQFADCYSKDFVLEAALMPDAHSGYVAPIGSVIKTKGAVVPAWVGYDIGCGMIAVRIADKAAQQNLIKRKAKEIFVEVARNVPMGFGNHNPVGSPVYLADKMESALEKLKESTKYEWLYKEVREKSMPNLGTLGSGNHFIEISTHEYETWLVIHSGSRSVGYHIGTTFMKLVSGLNEGYENSFAFTDDKMRDEYMHFQDFCLEFALLNRMSMAMKVEDAIRRITGIKYDTYANLWTNKNHNHCIRVGDNIFLHRKGATSSDKGERGVIPGNMRDGCYLVEGLGNEDFLCSSSHGAGRRMSRVQAKKEVRLTKFKETMKGVVAPVNLKTIDESPFVYKNISSVMEFQKESVKIIKHLKPIINWKGY